MQHYEDKMWYTVSLRFIFLVCACFVEHSQSQNCKTGVPKNCTFEIYNTNSSSQFTFCDWNGAMNWAVRNSNNDLSIGFQPSVDIALISSEVACSTGEKTLCFTLSYEFKPDDDVTLSVYILLQEGESGRKLWSLSSGSGKASVPVQSEGSYMLLIEAKRGRSSSKDSTVYVDDFIFTQDSTCTLQPEQPAAKATDLKQASLIKIVIPLSIALVIAIGIVLFLVCRLRRMNQTARGISRGELASDNAAYVRNSDGEDLGDLGNATGITSHFARPSISTNFYSSIRNAQTSVPTPSERQETGNLYSTAYKGKNSIVPTNQPSTTTQDAPNSDYNSLDFDEKGKGVQRHSAAGPGAVYSHLQTGNEDRGYTTVDRLRKEQVIDEEYSRVQQN